jgi:hypothetical protein
VAKGGVVLMGKEVGWGTTAGPSGAGLSRSLVDNASGVPENMESRKRRTRLRF